MAKSQGYYSAIRRQTHKAFNVEVDKELMRKFETYLAKNNISKKQWFDMKLAETLNEIE
jgi:predicted HicB family RNase H-like nuclease